MVGSGITTLLYSLATLTGFVSVEEAIRGQDVDSTPLTPEERIVRGYLGIIGVVTSGTAIGSIINRFTRPGVILAPKTGTVWDSIKGTQPVYEGTVIPKSFELTTQNGKVWVHGNATEHLAEYAGGLARRGMSPEYIRSATQSQIKSLHAAIQDVTKCGIEYGKMYNVGGWELKFAAPREAGQHPAVLHALMK